MAINELVFPYPDFKLNDMINPDEFDLNNIAIVDKLNEVRIVLNQVTDSITDGASGADKISLTAITPFISTKLQTFLEDLVARLRSVTPGTGGTDFIGASPLAGVTGTTLVAQLSSLKTLIDAAIASGASNLTSHKNAATLDHPDLSVTTAKVANSAITDTKLATDSVTTTKVINSAITNAKIAAGTITEDKLVAGTLDNRYYTESEIDAMMTTRYSKAEMQTSGQAQLHWGNLTNVPAMGDSSWKTPVSNVAALPSSGNANGDLRIVLDADTVYTYDGTTSAWKVIGASGNGISDHGTLVGLADDDHTQYLRTDGARTLGGNMNFGKYKAINLVEDNGSAFPSFPAVGQRFFRTDLDKSYIYTTSGWVPVSGFGALTKRLLITPSAGTTVLNLGASGTYEVNTFSMTVYKLPTGLFGASPVLLLSGFEYNETSTTAVTLTVPSSAGESYALYWLENTPAIVNATVKKDGTLQVNLNADYLDTMNSASTATASTIVARDASADITSRRFISTIASGTAPFSVTSTTLVTNLNADMLGSAYPLNASTANSIPVRDANGDILTRVFKSSVATGTAPFTVASTTMVTNLNANMVGGKVITTSSSAPSGGSDGDIWIQY